MVEYSRWRITWRLDEGPGASSGLMSSRLTMKASSLRPASARYTSSKEVEEELQSHPSIG